MKPILSLILGVALLGGFAQASDDEKVLKIGDPAPAWVKLPGIDGKLHSLQDLKDKDVIVVVFTCNSCSIAVAYEERIIAFQKKYCGPDQKVALVGINVNVIPEDLLPEMQKRAKAKGFDFLYLFDKSQKIAKDFGANVTPEFFVFGKERKLLYKGAMDNASIVDNVTTKYLEPAIDAILQGKSPATPETMGRGCKIRYLRKRDAD